jgi:hypothetical protein
MNSRLRKLLCYALICCVPACASTSSYELGERDPTETYSVLSRHIVSDQKIRVHLRDGTVIDMTAIAVTAETLNGLVDDNTELQKINLKDIVSVETNLNHESEKEIGRLLLVGLLAVGIIMWVVSSSGSAYDFSGISFGGGA